MKDMEYAKDKVLMGVERKSMIISDEEKAEHGLPRGRPRPGRGPHPRGRPDPQSHDHSRAAWPSA